MAKANVTLVEAQMGEGKTNTATALIADDYHAKLRSIVSPDGTIIPVIPYKLRTVKLPPPPRLQGKIDPRQYPKLVIPDGWGTNSDIRLFTNYHLYGMKYVYCDHVTMLEWLNTGVISHGKMVIDEGYIAGEARRAMNTLGLIYTWFAQQMRKRDIELYLLVQHGRFIDWRFRYIAKRKILTRYNENTHRIRLLIQDLVKGSEKVISYYAPTYWRFFNTNELPPVPEKIILKAAEWS